jgi:hypothetical protein
MPIRIKRLYEIKMRSASAKLAPINRWPSELNSGGRAFDPRQLHQ